MARKMAKENGRKAKALEAELAEERLARQRIEDELLQERERREQLESTRINPYEHPDVVSVRNEVLRDVRRGAVTLGLPKVESFERNFGSFMQAYLDAEDLSGADYDKAIQGLRSTIVASVSDIEFDDMDDTEQRQALDMANKAISLLDRNVDRTRKIGELVTDIEAKAKSGQLAVGSKDYQRQMAELQPILDSIGDLADDVIDADPYSIESIVAKMAKGSPETKRRVEAAKKDVLEILVGPRALTQEEADKLKANGTDLKAFLSQREKNLAERRKKLIPLLVQALASRAEVKKHLRKYSDIRRTEEQDESEFDALRRVTKKRTPPVKKVEKPVPASKRQNSALAEIVGDREDW